MATLEREMKAYAAQRGELERDHMGEWAIFYGDALEGLFPSFESAADVAVKKFGNGPYLIRQVGEQDVTLPASVLYFPLRAAG